MKLVTEEQKKPPNKRDISSTDFIGLFVDFSFEVMPVGGGECNLPNIKGGDMQRLT